MPYLLKPWICSLLFLAEVNAASLEAEENSTPSTEERLKDYARGYYLERAGEGEQAKALYQNLILQDPRSSQLHHKALAFLEREARLEERLRFAKASPQQVENWLGVADDISQYFYRSEAHLNISVKALQTALSLKPHHDGAVQRLFGVLEQLEMFESSLKLLESELTVSSSSHTRDLMLAGLVRSHFDAQDSRYLSEQERLYQRALSNAPERVWVARQVSDFYRKNDQLDKAIEVLETHRTACPSSLDLRTRLALLYLQTNREQEGLAELLTLTSINPELISSHQALAKFYQARGDHESSLRHQAILLPLQRRGEQSYLEIAKKYRALNQAHNAKLLLEKALFQFPESVPLMTELVIAAQEGQDLSLANKTLQQLKTKGVQPDKLNNSDFQKSRADSLIEEGHFKDAEAALRTAIRTYRNDQPRRAATAMRKLADLWDRQQIHKGAAASLRKRAKKLEQ